MKFRDEVGFVLIRLGAMMLMLLIALFFFTGSKNTDEVIAFIEPCSESTETTVPEVTLETWVEAVETFVLPTETTEVTEQTEPVQERTDPEEQEASAAMDYRMVSESPTESTTEPTQWEEPQIVERYQDVPLTQEEYWELAAIIWLEARNQSPEGQQAVAEVILNRVLHSGFPDTVYGVIHQGENTDGQQFEPVGQIYQATPGQDQIDAIEGALYGPSILSVDAVFFSRKPENDRIFRWIGDHVFCHEYRWK